MNPTGRNRRMGKQRPGSVVIESIAVAGPSGPQRAGKRTRNVRTLQVIALRRVVVRRMLGGPHRMLHAPSREQMFLAVGAGASSSADILTDEGNAERSRANRASGHARCLRGPDRRTPRARATKTRPRTAHHDCGARGDRENAIGRGVCASADCCGRHCPLRGSHARARRRRGLRSHRSDAAHIVGGSRRESERHAPFAGVGVARPRMHRAGPLRAPPRFPVRGFESLAPASAQRLVRRHLSGAAAGWRKSPSSTSCHCRSTTRPTRCTCSWQRS